MGKTQQSLSKRSEGFSVGDVAKRSAVSVATLHFYESKGLIASWRTSGNQRRFDTAVLRRVAVIKTAQRLGISLQEIAQALSQLPADKAPSTADWKKMSTEWRSLIQQRISQLEHLRDDLDSCIGCGCLSLKACKLRNPDDAAAKRGTGAVFWEPKD